MNPRASIVIPAYNADRWISKTIWSCRNQSIKQIEIIVVNDGSTDQTKDILDWHAKEDKRIRVFHRENVGRSAARNFGNEQAESEIIMVLDADDLATKERAKATLSVFELKKPGLMYGSFHPMDSFGNANGKDEIVPCKPFDPVESKKKKMNFICHSTMAYTKKLAMDVKYEDGVWSKLGLDDWKFQWEAYRKGYKFQHIKNPLCYYRITESGAMGTRDPIEVNTVKNEYFAKV